MGATVPSPKDALIGLIESLPEDSTYEEILQEIVIARMVDRGLADVDAGRAISDEEMRQTIDSWDEE